MENRNCDGGCTKSDVERVEEEWEEMTDRRNWRQLSENIVTEN